jgi:phosphatidylserine/phosphatidylglycerophosphate/cardiolipin synthase-like enzyme
MLRLLASFVGRQIERGVHPLSHRVRHGLTIRDLDGGHVGNERQVENRGEWWVDEPIWYPGGTPPRRHNRIDPLIDGSNYLAALMSAFATAEHSVTVAGWCLTPHTPLQRDDPQALIDSRLLPALIDLATRLPVRILLWGGAPFLIQPTTRVVQEVKQELDAEAAKTGADLRCELDMTARFSHCHHQKTVVIDDKIAFLGGMDLTTFQGDRWDQPGHPLRAGVNWHDVQVRIEGEVVADVAANFRERWEAATGEPLTLAAGTRTTEPAMATPAQIVRTIPARTYEFLPQGEFGIYHAYIELFRRARRFIYLENQYLWSPEVVDALLAALEREQDPAFRIVLILPARAYSGKWDNDRRVNQLRAADKGRGRVAVYSLYASGPHLGTRPFRSRPIYVHAKVAIIDDEWLMVGSANLNTRGLVTDSEINVLIRDSTQARNLRVALWAEHLGMDPAEVDAAEPVALLDDAWQNRSAINADVLAEGDKPLPCSIHRYETGRAKGAWLLEEAESLTFEH